MLLCSVTVVGISYKDKITPLEGELKKIQIVSSLRIHLLEAIEAEKNAVLAITDEASKRMLTRHEVLRTKWKTLGGTWQRSFSKQALQKNRRLSLDLTRVG